MGTYRYSIPVQGEIEGSVQLTDDQEKAIIAKWGNDEQKACLYEDQADAVMDILDDLLDEVGPDGILSILEDEFNADGEMPEHHVMQIGDTEWSWED